MDRRIKIENIATVQHSNVPAFLLKLRNLLDDPENDPTIAWDESGESFHLYDQVNFAKDILPKYFKHSNLASFVRQLNMYGFKKIASIEHGGLQSKEDMEFHNPHFVRDHPEYMDLIKRKNPKAERQASTSLRERINEYNGALRPSNVEDVLVDVKSLKHSQDDINQQLDIIKRENSVLWREIANLRQKHSQQQLIINKLIQFLLTVAPRRNMKRSLPMIEDGPSKKKTVEVSSIIPTVETPDINVVQDKPVFLPHETSKSPARIKDVTDDEVLGSSVLYPVTDTSDCTEIPILNADAIPTVVLDNLEAPNVTHNIVVVPKSSSPFSPSSDALQFKLDFSENLDEFQTDIDLLKDYFTKEPTFQLSQDAVYSLFEGENSAVTSFPITLNGQGLDGLNDFIDDSSSNRKEDFLDDVTTQLPDENLVDTQFQDLFDTDSSEHIMTHVPVISSHDLD